MRCISRIFDSTLKLKPFNPIVWTKYFERPHIPKTPQNTKLTVWNVPVDLVQDPPRLCIRSWSQPPIRITTRSCISFYNDIFTLSDSKHDVTDALTLNETIRVIARLYFLFLVWTETEIGNLVFFQVVLEVIPSSMIVDFANDNAWAANNFDWVTWKYYESIVQIRSWNRS